ncbi:hypothetical protein [Ktedonospora formicarum]|uniref:Uncharacterized protein n=1 Tax=Ktedonospora formicarum TaxID=2778364 RepID=A0A8J3HWU1_9CHLR|nr:hypothetical protein [Ktedonospora formicarum]GHO45542.1 hypothetical protein KSX_37050 [Ktedonospora formicarum]
MPREKKPRVDPRALIARIHQQSQEALRREIIAPVLPQGRIRTRIAGLVYEFELVPKDFVGWGRFRPRNEREVELIEEAQPWERGGYLELLPALRVVLLWPDNTMRVPGTWWAIPFNSSDAHQRFGISAEPIPILLCDPGNGAERFERAIARVDGKQLWFEGPDLRSDPRHAEWLRDATTREDTVERLLSGLAASERQAFLIWQVRQLEKTLAEERRASGFASDNIALEARLRYALAKADARLHSFSELPGYAGAPSHLVVEWSMREQDYRYRSTIDTQLNVVSSGICLSDRDSDFDLTSLVDVMINADDPYYDWE